MRRRYGSTWAVTLNVIGEDELFTVHVPGHITKNFAVVAAKVQLSIDLQVKHKFISYVGAKQA